MAVNPALVPSFRFINNVPDDAAHPSVVKALRSASNAFTDIYSAIAYLKGNQVPAAATTVVASSGSSVTPPVNPPIYRTPHDVTASRLLDTIYQNTTGNEIVVSGCASAISGGSVGTLVFTIGPTASPSIKIWGNEFTATVAGSDLGFSGLIVPNSYYYVFTAGGDIATTPNTWIEFW